MQLTGSKKTNGPPHQFVCRQIERLRLQQLHAQQRHVLIVCPEGVGKTALVTHLKTSLDLLVSPRSANFRPICDSLEAGLGLKCDNVNLPARRHRLLGELAQTPRTVVFDDVGWITPKLSSFLELVMERAPIWICTRSTLPWDIGHFWTWLVRFEKIELHPLRPSETLKLLNSAIVAGQIPSETLRIVDWLHRHSQGNPLRLREFIAELAAKRYDLNNPRALRRLDLDRRIHGLFPGQTDKAKEITT